MKYSQDEFIRLWRADPDALSRDAIDAFVNRAALDYDAWSCENELTEFQKSQIEAEVNGRAREINEIVDALSFDLITLLNDFLANGSSRSSRG